MTSQYIIKVGTMFVLLLFIFTGCSSETAELNGVEVVELEEYETVVAFEDNLLATPISLAFDGESSLFVYDIADVNVLELDAEGNLKQGIGRRGSGPGGFRIVNNLFVNRDSLYFIDAGQFLIHHYNRDGGHLSSFDYGEIGYIPSTPPPPVNINNVLAKDLTRQPHVTMQGHLMLSSFFTDESTGKIFDLINWEGERITQIGDLPDGGTFVMDNNKYRNSISNREVPALEKPNVFPVNDKSNPEEIFLIYSAIPKIAKYNLSGEKLWEREVQHTAEIDSVANNYYENMDRLSPGSRMTLNKYMAGTSTPSGDLYLATNSNPGSHSPLWIHKFNTDGDLITRFRIKSEVTIPPIFDIDPVGRRIFVVTEEAEIRAYQIF